MKSWPSRENSSRSFGSEVGKNSLQALGLLELNQDGSPPGDRVRGENRLGNGAKQPVFPGVNRSMPLSGDSSSASVRHGRPILDASTNATSVSVLKCSFRLRPQGDSLKNSRICRPSRIGYSADHEHCRFDLRENPAPAGKPPIRSPALRGFLLAERHAQSEAAEWSRFSASQLANQYAPEEAIDDQK